MTKQLFSFCLITLCLFANPLHAKYFPAKDSLGKVSQFSYKNSSTSADNFQETHRSNKPDPDPEIQKEIAKAVGTFDELEKIGNYIHLLNPNDLKELPVGIKESIGNVEYSLVVTKAKFTPEFALINVYARITTPQQDAEGGKQTLYFGAEGIKLSYEGKIVGNAKLSLLGDVNLIFNNKEWMLTLEGGRINKINGESYNNNTYVIIDCNGVKEMALKGNVQISRNVLLPLDENGKIAPEFITLNGKSVSNRVRGDFQINTADWNDLLVSVKLNPFAITKQAQNSDKGYFSFFMNQAILDLSDLRTDPRVVFPKQYISQGYFVSGTESWRGLFIENLTIGLPEEIKTSDNPNTPVKLEAKNLLIDNYGVSGSLVASNVFPLEKGITSEENAWRYSIDKIGVDLAASKIVGANLEGVLQLPIQKKETDNNQMPNQLGYKGLMTEEEYLIGVKTINDIKFDIWSAKATIASGSSVELKVRNKEFLPKAILNGSLQIDANASLKEAPSDRSDVQFKGITFQELTIQTQAPFLTVDYFGVEGEQKLANFPVSISDIYVDAQDSQANLGFTLTVGLQEEKFSASGGMTINGLITSEGGRQKWMYDGFTINKLALRNVDIGVASVSGELEFMNRDPLYGRGFKAFLKAEITKLKGVEVMVNAHFGNSTFRYWGFEGSVDGLKIPVGVPGLIITGFVGGAFYHMLPDRDMSLLYKNKALAMGPDESVGLALRAGVYGAIANNDLVSFMAGFNMNTNPNGGLANIGFVGEALVMEDITAISSDPLAKVKEKFGDMMGKSKFISDLQNNQPVAHYLDTSQVATVYPLEQKQPSSIYGKLAMNFDFNNSVFHATLDVFVNVANGLIKGVGPAGRAGWAVMHIAPKDWYLHIGTPTDMIGLRVGVGSISVQSGSYFMVGTRIPGSPPPPIEVAQILGLSLNEIDYMKDLNALGEGRGFAFGTHFKFDTGDMTAFFLYARFQAGIGGDVMLKNYGEARCINRSSRTIGIDGWYANGQAYAYLQGELGIKIKLFFIRKRIPIIKAGAAALLQAKGPNPIWMRGYLGGNYNLLGGMIRGKFRFKLEFGEKCQLQNESILGGMKIITDLTPKKNDNNTSVFAIPQATFALRVNEPIVIPEDDGDHTYKVIVEKMTIVDAEGTEIKGTIDYAKSKDVANFVSEDILPPNKTLKAITQVSFMEKKNGIFQVLTVDGQKATETEEREFTTGTAPNNIPLTNIQYNYPVVQQENFYANERNKGYIKLKRGQDYLFDDPNWLTSTQFKQANQLTPSDFSYNSTSNEIVFAIPTLQKQKEYFFSLVAKNKNITTTENAVVTKTETMEEGEEDSSITVETQTKTAQNVSKDGEIDRLAFSFRTSKYNTFEEKMNTFNFKPLWIKVSSDVIALQNNTTTDEYFDATELLGSAYTDNKPLIDIKAFMDDVFARKFKYLFYDAYPLDQLTLNRADDEDDTAGIPPTRALPIFTSYLQYLDKEQGHPFLKQTFPYQYNLFSYYKKDWYEMVSKAASKYILVPAENRPREINTLMQSNFGVIPTTTYQVNAKYTLPGEKPGSNKIFNFEYK